VVILAGDHIYKMNYEKMVEFHQENEADMTIGALRVGVGDAHQFGIMEIDAGQRVIGFEEKPTEPKTVPDHPGHCFASMGIYVFNTAFLFEQLCQDATRGDSSHDFGKNIIPAVIDSHRVFAFPFRDENLKDDAYWRDVGTLDAYFEANMDLVSVDPLLNLYDDRWLIRTYQPNLPPPKFVFAGRGGNEDRCGRAMDSIVCQGTIISGGLVERSIIGPRARVNSYSRVEDSILFSNVDIGRRARVRRAIIDKDVCVPPGVEIGYDLELDRDRGFTVTDGGVVVIAKAAGVEHLIRNGSSASR
jgi:glucose-1-phosphate adenylyltransferase